MFVSKVGIVENKERTFLINVPNPDWDTEGLALVQVAVNEGYVVEVMPTDFDIQVEVKHKSFMDSTNEQLNDLGIYLIDQATE